MTVFEKIYKAILKVLGAIHFQIKYNVAAFFSFAVVVVVIIFFRKGGLARKNKN